MVRFLVAIASLALLVGLASAGCAVAGPITYDLSVVSSSRIGSGTLGNITLIQNGPNQVVVGVRLASGTSFVTTGGPHNTFAFNLDLKTPYTVAIIDPLGNIFSSGHKDAWNTPYGTFTDGIACPGCGPGASHANPGPLNFSVTDAGGITVSDFVANLDGFYFSADVRGPSGGTGNIAASGATSILTLNNESAVPEPASLPLLAGGMLALGIIVRRRKRREVHRTSPTR